MCQVTSVVSDSLQSFGPQLARLLCPQDSPGRNTGAGCCALLQGILPTQVSNARLLCLPRWLVGSLPLVPPGKLMRSIIQRKKSEFKLRKTWTTSQGQVYLEHKVNQRIGTEFETKKQMRTRKGIAATLK